MRFGELIQDLAAMMRGGSAAGRRLLGESERAAASNATVLLEGEPGSGKETCARLIHALGPRGTRPFVPLRCGTVMPELFERELSGPLGSLPEGLLGLADGGTLYLGEISELHSGMDVTMERVLDARDAGTLATTMGRPIDVRMIVSTMDPIRELIAAGRFRHDLGRRLQAVRIRVPSLRERPEDIAPLARFFLAHLERETSRRFAGFDEETLRLLEARRWPGNLRELEHTINRLIFIAEPGQRLGADLLRPRSDRVDLALIRAALERPT